MKLLIMQCSLVPVTSSLLDRNILFSPYPAPHEFGQRPNIQLLHDPLQYTAEEASLK